MRLVEAEVKLRPTVSRPVCHGVRRPSGTRDQFFFLLEISFGQLRVCYFVAPSLTRRRVCNLPYNCYYPLPEHSLFGRSLSELTAVFYCLIWDSPNLKGQVLVFISARNRLAQGTGFCFSNQRWRYSNPSPHGEERSFYYIYIGIQFVPHRNHITLF
jgi:hypothetical protein